MLNILHHFNRTPVFKRWQQLRLVCRQFREWFGLDSIQKFSGKLNKLASNGLLEGMINLKSLKLLASKVDKESLEHLASMIPCSLQYLDSCSVELLQLLSSDQSSSLQTVIARCRSSDSQIIQAIKGTFAGKIKHLRIVYNNPLENEQELISWRDALYGLDLKELTLEPPKNLIFDESPLIPATLERLNYLGSNLELESLSAAVNLQVLRADLCNFTFSPEMPKLPMLKELTADEIYFEDFNNDSSPLHSYLPNLESLDINPTSNFGLPYLKQITSLRSLTIDCYMESPYTDDVYLSNFLPLL